MILFKGVHNSDQKDIEENKFITELPIKTKACQEKYFSVDV